MISSDRENLLLQPRVTDTSTPNFVPKPPDYLLRPKLYIPLDFNDIMDRRFLQEEDDDQLRWYPMRLRYCKEKKACEVRDKLHERGYETYLHIQPHIEWRGQPHSALQDSICNLIFVHARKAQLRLLKHYDPKCTSMQFWAKRPLEKDGKTEILWIPDLQMTHFIDYATRPDPLRQRMPLIYTDFIGKQDREVLITQGPFAGVKGEVKRIKHRRIVVALIRDAQTAIGICSVPPEHLMFI